MGVGFDASGNIVAVDYDADIDLNVSPHLVAMYEETGRLESLAVTDSQIEAAALACLRYVQRHLPLNSDDGFNWGHFDGCHPFEQAIRKALGREKR